jgi:hypothetical protein
MPYYLLEDQHVMKEALGEDSDKSGMNSRLRIDAEVYSHLKEPRNLAGNLDPMPCLSLNRSDISHVKTEGKGEVRSSGIIITCF